MLFDEGFLLFGECSLMVKLWLVEPAMRVQFPSLSPMLDFEPKDKDMISVKERLTSCAEKNLQINSLEYARRFSVGLITSEILDPCSQIRGYLDRVKTVDPVVNQFIDNLILGKQIAENTELIITIPAVGFGNQEQNDLTNTLVQLSNDKLIIDKKVQVIVLVNRPEGKSKDSTAETARKVASELNINCTVLESEIPLKLGNTQGTFSDEMALDKNEAPIGLLRDILNISAMQLWLRSNTAKAPILLQMDADFVGFKNGDLTTLINYFEGYKDLQFLQCTSDWENPNKPLKEIDYSLWLGAELMRELPQLVKRYLGQNIPDKLLQQFIFGEVIQRGIQVPQAERMESIARKGGFGLNRLKEDELDTNIRMTALVFGSKSIGSTNQIIFNWSSRRAEQTWKKLRKPPISQWATPFLADDSVRSTDSTQNVTQDNDLLNSVSRTLERLPYPKAIFDVDPNFKITFLDVLKRYIPELTDQNIEMVDKGNGTFLFKIV